MRTLICLEQFTIPSPAASIGDLLGEAEQGGTGDLFDDLGSIGEIPPLTPEIHQPTVPLEASSNPNPAFEIGNASNSGPSAPEKSYAEQIMEDPDFAQNIPYRNALLKENSICLSIEKIFKEEGIRINIHEIRREVYCFLHDVLKMEPRPRAYRLNKIIRELSDNAPKSAIYRYILKEKSTPFLTIL